MGIKNYKGTIAYGSAPCATGTSTFYLNWAPALRQRGWKVFSVAVGKRAAEESDPRFGDEYSVILAPEETALSAQVQAFRRWVEERKVGIVIPTYENNIIAAIPHLPECIRYITICHNIIRSAYVVSTRHPERLNFAVAINKVQVEKLHHVWKISLEKIRLIPNAIDLTKFNGNRQNITSNEAINLIYIGKINHDIKGVLWLPAILKELCRLQIPFLMHIAGAGPDIERLHQDIAKNGIADRVHFHGVQSQRAVMDLLSHGDILLMPSRFEGFGLVLAEAMAMGCVPIATYLEGITNMIVEEGVSGFLCPMGKTRVFAERIALLARDRKRLALMAEAARRKVVAEFGADRMADDYDALFTEALSQPPISFTPRELEQLTYPKELLPTWRAMVPQPVKTFVRTWANRLFGRVI